MKTSEVYKHLYHYTDWNGLNGILENQTLWATHFKFLNDYSEIMLFMEEVLPDILHPHVYEKYNKIIDSLRLPQEEINAAGDSLDRISLDDTLMAIESLYDPLREQIYIASFCGESTNEPYVNEHGLLSQWRGYGKDGGFAIILDTEEIEKLMSIEHNSYLYGYSSISDVVYSYDKNAFERELAQDIDNIVNFVATMAEHIPVQKEIDKDLKAPYREFLSCITRYKHRGFSEENEVRLVLHLTNYFDHPDPDERIKKPINYREHKSGAAPYLELFSSHKNKLPIKRIIVGPHKEKEARAAYLRTKLIETDIEVSISDIPYTG